LEFVWNLDFGTWSFEVVSPSFKVTPGPNQQSKIKIQNFRSRIAGCNRQPIAAQLEPPTERSIEMEDVSALREQIKSIMVENLMLQMTAAEIADDLALFGPGSLGLDSVDALQLVVALDKTFGLKIADPAAARQILHSVNTIVQAVQQNSKH
jgi:acyl carrier protein